MSAGITKQLAVAAVAGVAVSEGLMITSDVQAGEMSGLGDHAAAIAVGVGGGLIVAAALLLTQRLGRR